MTPAESNVYCHALQGMVIMQTATLVGDIFAYGFCKNGDNQKVN